MQSHLLVEEGYSQIQGYKVISKHATALKILGETIGKEIPIISDAGKDKFGAVIWFKKIIGISLNSCGLQEIPDEIFDLETLRFLYLSNNQIKNIPSQIMDLLDLETLSLSENQISRVPELPKKITHVDLSKNRLSGNIQLKLRNIRILNLAENNITEFGFLKIPQYPIKL